MRRVRVMVRLTSTFLMLHLLTIGVAIKSALEGRK